MSSWITLPLGERTINLDRRRVPITSRDRQAGPYPYYGASGIVDHVSDFLFEGTHLLVAEDGENLRTRKTPIAFLASGQFWVNNHAHVLLANSENDLSFLAYAVEASDLNGFITGSTQPKLNQSALNRIPISAPAKPEQARISTVLRLLDDKIAACWKERRLLRQLGQAELELFLEAGQSSTLTIRDVVSSIARGVAPKYADGSESAPPVLNQKCIRDGWIDLLPARRMEDRSVAASRKAVEGDILVNSTGTGTLGRLARFDGGAIFVDGHISIVRPDPQRVDPTVLAYSLFSREREIEGLATGSTGQTELSAERLGGLTVTLPTQPGSTILEESLRVLEKRSAYLADEVTRLTKTRDDLIPLLLSGAVRPGEVMETLG